MFGFDHYYWISNYNLFLQVNVQEPYTDIKNMNWTLQNTADWEHFFVGEPTEHRVDREIPEDLEALTAEEEISKEKHLDMPATWVRQLHIGNAGLKMITFH